jgi:signal transduction histidine kinase
VERKGQIVLSVVDDGVGFPSKMVDWPRHKGLGLPLMKYRARMIGGQLSIARRRGGGTILACSVPVTVAQRPESDHAS